MEALLELIFALFIAIPGAPKRKRTLKPVYVAAAAAGFCFVLWLSVLYN